MTTTTPKPRTPDHTRALRANRRQALLDAAAARMGRETWQRLATEFRSAVETAETDAQASDNLRALCRDLLAQIKDGRPDLPPADVVAAIAAYPLGRSGNPQRRRKS